VNYAPSRLHSNRFACLDVNNDVRDTIDESTTENAPEPIRTEDAYTPPPSIRIPKWERKLPKRMVIDANTSSQQLQLEVELQTTDTERTFRLHCLLDCGASGLFLDKDYVARHQIPTRKLSRPIPVLNVDGTPNGAGAITDVVNVILRYNDHSERTTFAVTSLGKQDMILGHPWLPQHNPEVDWKTGEVKMTRCDS
jgi:hypothetical protein